MTRYPAFISYVKRHAAENPYELVANFHQLFNQPTPTRNSCYQYMKDVFLFCLTICDKPSQFMNEYFTFTDIYNQEPIEAMKNMITTMKIKEAYEHWN